MHRDKRCLATWKSRGRLRVQYTILSYLFWDSYGSNRDISFEKLYSWESSGFQAEAYRVKG